MQKPKPEQLFEIKHIGTNAALAQERLRVEPEADFFLPRQIEGYAVEANRADDHYWEQRFIGRTAMRDSGLWSMRLIKTEVRNSEVWNEAHVNRKFYIFEWDNDAVERAELHQHYSRSKAVAGQVIISARSLLMTDLDESMSAGDKRELDGVGCEELTSNLIRFTRVSNLIHFRTLGVNGSTKFAGPVPEALAALSR